MFNIFGLLHRDHHTNIPAAAKALHRQRVPDQVWKAVSNLDRSNYIPFFLPTRPLPNGSITLFTLFQKPNYTHASYV